MICSACGRSSAALFSAAPEHDPSFCPDCLDDGTALLYCAGLEIQAARGRALIAEIARTGANTPPYKPRRGRPPKITNR